MNLPFEQKKLVIFLSLALSQLVFTHQAAAQTIEIGVDVPAYDPTTHDGTSGGPAYNGPSATNVNGGATITLTASDVQTAFIPGSGPTSVSVSLTDLAAAGRVEDPNNILNSERLNIGPENNAISIPDPITGGKITIPTYDSSQISSAGIVGDAMVSVYQDVNNEQYINTRIANVAGGTLNVDLGTAGNAHTDATNHLDMAAKQTELFTVDGTGGQSSVLNWSGKNRVTFFGATVEPPFPGSTNYTASNVATYSGAISVTTLDGTAHAHNVTDAASLATYNSWLISQLEAGNLDGSRYDELFNLAVTLQNKQIEYGHLVTDSNDEIFQSAGKRVVIHAFGSDAQVNITGMLETENASSTVVLEDGASVLVDTGGVLGNVNGSVITLSDTSSAVNNGVINGGFTVKDDNITIDSSGGGGVKNIVVGDETSFSNNGILNVNTNKGGGDAAGIYLKNTAVATGPEYLGADGVYYSAGNSASGIINVGVTGSSASGTTSGVMIDSALSSFINEGAMYLGRTNQNTAADGTTDTAINQRGLLSGIYLVNGGTAVNTGSITLGTKVQNAAAMYSAGGDATVMRNSGSITLTDNSSLGIPNASYGMLVRNSGADGGIVSEGSIELQGVNGIGIKVLATGNNKAQASTTVNSQIILNGAADPTSGTRNYGVWVEGQGTQTAYANIDGTVKLAGDGAIGIHARGNAEVDVSNLAIPQFISGEKQIGIFAYGDKAKVNLTGKVTTTDVSKVNSYSTISNAGMNSNNVTGMLVQNGAQLYTTGRNKIDLSSGTNNTGISIASGGQVEQHGTINVDNGTGIAITGVGSTLLNRTSPLTVNQGIGIDISNGGAVSNQTNITVNDGTGIRISGARSSLSDIGNVTVHDGTAGIQVLNNAKVIMNGSNGTVTTDGTAHGILMDTGAAAFKAANTTINVLGTGHGIENTAEVSSITLKDTTINVKDGSGIRTGVTIDSSSSATINVSGNGTGFAFVKQDGTTLTTGNLLMGQGYTINVLGAGGIGIEGLTDGGDVLTGATVNVTNPAGGAALVAGTARQSINFGKLNSVSTTAPVVDLTNSTKGTSFANIGRIFAASPTSTAVAGSASADALRLIAGAVRGDVNSGNGNDYVLFNGGTLEGSITMGSGENKADIVGVDLSTVRHITSGTSGKNALLLSEIRSSGGSLAADNLAKGVNLGTGWNRITLDNTAFTLTDNLTLDDSVRSAGVLINNSSTLYAGNDVKPVISGSSKDLTVQNLGRIDLTNGSSTKDQLTIKGNYRSLSGSLLMNTELNGGGALSNQFTDRLLIEGNVTGTTPVQLTTFSSGGSDAGMGTDTNFNNIVDADEGISIVQVAGTSTARAFYLPNGYVSSGAFAYDLNAFAPGDADADQRVVGGAGATRAVGGAGSQFWDYRLANKMYGNRKALVPQGSSYLSLATGLSHYNMLVIDDLHKRLGEIRVQNATAIRDAGLEPDKKQFFIRAIGGDYDYKSNISHEKYGYDFDLKLHALQVGMNLLNLGNDDDSNIRVGAAWTHGSSTIKPSNGSEGITKVKTDSDMLGLYVTWQNVKGFYLDGVLAYAKNRSHISSYVRSNMNNIASKDWIASIEGGYNYKLNEDWAIEPQVQLSYTNTKFKKTIDYDGAVVKFSDYDQLIGRIGARVTRTWINDDNTRYIPYARVNYYHSFSSEPKVNISALGSTSGGYNFRGGKYGDSLQLGLGLTVLTKENFAFFIEGDYQKEIGSAGLKGFRGLSLIHI